MPTSDQLDDVLAYHHLKTDQSLNNLVFSVLADWDMFIAFLMNIYPQHALFAYTIEGRTRCG